jgi:hypothetical protein
LLRLQQIGPATIQFPRLESSSHQNETLQVTPDLPQHSLSRDLPIPSEERPAKRQRVEAPESEDRPAQRQEIEARAVQLRRFKSPNGQFYPMQLAARDDLNTILSGPLQMGMHETEVWKSERQQFLTQTVCLFWPHLIGDFVLDLIVSKRCATVIAEARRDSENALQTAMGDFLFQGMMKSDCVKNGVLTDAVMVLNYEGSDAIVRIVLSNLQGWEASRVFPSTG